MLWYKMTKYCTLTHTFVPFWFSAQIVFRQPVAKFALCQQWMIEYAQ